MLRFALILLFAAPALAAEKPIEFNRDIRPILSENCFACHGPDSRKVKSKLRFDVEKIAKAPAASGATAIVPGKPKENELLIRVNATDGDHMPPAESGKKLTKEQIALLTRWIEAGAKWEDHWAFTPIKRSEIPASPQHSIDYFIREKLKDKGLAMSPEADRITLIRRLSFDLIGLPPTPQEVDDFLKDKSPNAYEKVVDRLLKSPHYGERLAMFWLDIVRYADSVGYHGDQVMSVWPYRDYVIKSFNENKPFDVFTKEQLAGDLLPNATKEQKIASGYNRLGMMSAEGGVQPKEYLAKYASERVRAVSGGWLGLTVGCAECHDHKFDAVTTKDFYRLEAFFADITEQGLYSGSSFGTSMVVASAEQEKKLAELDAALEKTTKLELPFQAVAGVLGGSLEAKKIAQETKTRDDFRNKIPTTLITVPTKPREIRVLKRGNWLDTSGEVVTAGTPSGLPTPKKTEKLTRLDLAEWLMAKDNPLPARVLANRLWKLYFGAGLSRKLDDLGSQGEPPTHPELLDHLAAKLLDSGWDIRAFIKYLVMCDAYRQSSMASAELRERDPFNFWLARQSRFRLDAELVRDNALVVSGLLVRTLGGPSVKPYQPGGYWSFLNFPKREWQNDSGESLYRRGLYTHWQRQYLHPALLAFDAPSREECTADRVRSNTPLQSLTLLNAPEFVEAARMFAERVMKEGGKTPGERLDFAFHVALSRPIRPEEAKALEELFAKQLAIYEKAPATAKELLTTGAKKPDTSLNEAELAAWTSVTRTILNLHASVTRY
jgi:mono/diheme cytochrome c family protein